MKAITSEEFDEKFDAGEDITKYLDFSRTRRPNRGKAIKRVNVDFPEWMVKSLDKEAARLGITRQALIKVWVASQLDGGRA